MHSDARTTSASGTRIMEYETPTLGNGRTRRSTDSSTDPPTDRFTGQTDGCMFSRCAGGSDRGLCAAAARWAGGSNRDLWGGDATRSWRTFSLSQIMWGGRVLTLVPQAHRGPESRTMRTRRWGMDERAGRQTHRRTHQQTDSPTDKPTDACFRNGRAAPTGASVRRRRRDGRAAPIGVCVGRRRDKILENF